MFKKWLPISALLCVSFSSQAGADNPQVIMETSKGTIQIELMEEQAPITVKNFLSYVDSGFYNGTIFHRVIPNFVIQGGGMDKSMERKETQTPIANESKNRVKNERGTLSMARTQDPNSATTQFFINLHNNSNLDYQPGREGYAVFAKVIQGIDVVDAVARVKTGTVGPYADVPLEPVTILSVSRVQADKGAEEKKAGKH